MITPALRTAANLVTGDDAQTDQFLKSKPWDAWIFQWKIGWTKNQNFRRVSNNTWAVHSDEQMSNG